MAMSRQQQSPPVAPVAGGLGPQQLIAQEQMIRSVIRRIVADPSLVEDLTQETWLAALRHTAAGRFLERAWLGRVAQNFAFQAMRGRARRIARETAVARALAIDPADGQGLDPELRERLLAALESLDEPQRTALRLRFFDDLTPTAIAARLGIPAETVRTRIKRALRRVQLDLARGARSPQAGTGKQGST
jgi:RNA polymerase sigma-70 factor (ECF subfamily)